MTAGAPGLPAQLRGDREPGRVRELEVEQHEVGRAAARGGDAGGGVRGLADHGEALGLEQPPCPRTEAAVIVDDQHRGSHAPDCPAGDGRAASRFSASFYAARASGRTNHSPTMTAATAPV